MQKAHRKEGLISVPSAGRLKKKSPLGDLGVKKGDVRWNIIPLNSPRNPSRGITLHQLFYLIYR
jgi:hypothetical protein